MGNNSYTVGQYVLLHTNDEWNGLYGIIEKITESTLTVFCINLPWWRYYLNLDDFDSLQKTLEIIPFEPLELLLQKTN